MPNDKLFYPTELCIDIGSHCGPSYMIKLEGNHLLYYAGWYVQPLETRPKPEQWFCFW